MANNSTVSRIRASEGGQQFSVVSSARAVWTPSGAGTAQGRVSKVRAQATTPNPLTAVLSGSKAFCEPGETITLDASGSVGSIAMYTFVQLAGTPVSLITGNTAIVGQAVVGMAVVGSTASAATRTFKSTFPAGGEVLTFRVTVSAAGVADSTADWTTTVYPVQLYRLVSGSWVPWCAQVM